MQFSIAGMVVVVCVGVGVCVFVFVSGEGVYCVLGWGCAGKCNSSKLFCYFLLSLIFCFIIDLC